ncbi:putative F-box protein At3g16210 [Salvia splendens]|uniref:putative F-box protein At3g16210 n=1 Tax=Salvia splendens TaxID=180675 RepID=UPI001C26F3D5|nr:putative F-box protein At3g16210 [Salvia splendens]
MEVDYFTNLPSEITMEILSHLSIRSLAISKSVCKSWRDLFDTVKSKIKTPPALVQIYWGHYSTRCKIIEIEDEDEADLHYHPLTDLEITGLMEGYRIRKQCVAANGLLLFYSTLSCPFYICNPITREYTELCCPVPPNPVMRFGFGVSEISQQYKVIGINSFPKSDLHYVYTLGTGTWRRLEAGKVSGFVFESVGCTICNGNLHWIVVDSSRIQWICSFDLETEHFSIFSLPLAGIRNGELSVLSDCLCYSYYNKRQDEILIWMMKEYQVNESWTVEYKMSTASFDGHYTLVHYTLVKAIKFFKDGDVLMLLDHSILVYYSNKTRTLQQVNMLKDADENKGYPRIFNPSLLSLKSFGFENVISF